MDDVLNLNSMINHRLRCKTILNGNGHVSKMYYLYNYKIIHNFILYIIYFWYFLVAARTICEEFYIQLSSLSQTKIVSYIAT